jgi:hypothetical protein
MNTGLPRFLSLMVRLAAAGLLAAIPGLALAAESDAIAPVSAATGMPVPARAAPAKTSSPSLTVGGGVAVNPIYEGSSGYAPFPSLAVKAVLPSDSWGTFTLSFPEGLRWDLPDVSTVGLAFLLGYDPGRKEKSATSAGIIITCAAWVTSTARRWSGRKPICACRSGVCTCAACRRRAAGTTAG